MSRLYLNRNLDANSNDNGRIAQDQWLEIFIKMAKTYKNIYSEIYSLKNLFFAEKEARKHKTKKDYVQKFEINFNFNLLNLYKELKNQTYQPVPLKTFILRDPKTRKISKSDFRDRVVHHALVRIIESIFDKSFIYDSCANRIRKGNLFALKRFDKFKRKVSHNGKTNGWFNNNQVKGYCLKADIKHYFEEVNHEILFSIIKRKIKDEKTLWLINKILNNTQNGEASRKGMPLGNLTSQFFANIYLNELDYFVKHKLRAEYYIRYVDDFVILHQSRAQLEIWEREIESFLKNKLKLELHPEKTKIIPISKGIDFIGFRTFYYYKLLRKRNIQKMFSKIKEYKKDKIIKEKILEIFQGWKAYSKWADSYNLRKRVVMKIYR